MNISKTAAAFAVALALGATLPLMAKGLAEPVKAGELQEIVDHAYADMVAQLTAAGFEVLDRAPLEAHPALAHLRGEPGPKEMTTITGRDDKAKVLFVGASQTQPLRLMPGDVAASGFGAMVSS